MTDIELNAINLLDYGMELGEVSFATFMNFASCIHLFRLSLEVDYTDRKVQPRTNYITICSKMFL